MSSTITGVGSGFDIESWVSQLVSAKKTSSLTPLQTKLESLQKTDSTISSIKTKFTTLQSALKAFTTTIYNSSSDMWTNTTITSSNDAYATAISTGSVASANVDLQIEQIATSTIAKSANSLGTISKENIESAKFVNLANGQAKAGTFSMFLDGKEYKIEIAQSDTVQDVIDKINTASDGKIQASVDDSGNFSIKAYKEQVVDGSTTYVEDTSANLMIGSGGDTSNIVTALKLNEKDGSGYKSAYPVSLVNTSAAMVSQESGLGEIKFFDEDGNPAQTGKITINGVDFEINETTTLNNLISRINGNSDANVKASYDSLTNKLVLTSTQTGQSNISLSEEGTNLLTVLGLTEGEGENEKLAEGSQTLGQNAIAYINGNKVISSSNTITGEASGIANLSITIKKPTSDYSNNEKDDKNVTLDISPDYTEVKEALNTFVKAYNDLVTTIRTETSSSGNIGHDSSLNSLLNNIRGVTSAISDNDGAFSMLAEIGISTSKSDAVNLTIDEEKLDKALSEDFESVKMLLSDGYTSKTDNGIFDQMLVDIENALDFENGYFANKSDSIQSQITSMNSRIERATNRITSYEERLYKQFNKMDSIISALNSQLSAFSSYLG